MLLLLRWLRGQPEDVIPWDGFGVSVPWVFPQAGLLPVQRLKLTNFPEQPAALPVRPEEQRRWV